MNVKHYNNVIDWTLKHVKAAQTEDSLTTARAVFKNMGVALPNGSMQEVYETIKTNNYMGWRACTMEEAQQAANKGTAAIGISKDRMVVLSAIDEEEPVAETASVMSLSGNTSAYAVAGLEYFVNSCGTTTKITVNGWLDLYTTPSVFGRIVSMPDGCRPNAWYSFEGMHDINPWARVIIGNTNVVNEGPKGELYDICGRYWVGVGPKVMNPNHADNAPVIAEEMNYGSRIDVILKHLSGRFYYLRAVVGEGKEHTYSNGIYQTGYKFPDGTDYHLDNVDGSVVEFCGAILAEGLDQFSIEAIVVEE